jgi:hypothetical protein
MLFRQFDDPATGALAYLVADAGAAVAVTIDVVPPQHALVLALLDERGLRLRWVLRTHPRGGALPAHGRDAGGRRARGSPACRR